MLTLTSLPPELIVQVMDHLDGFDLENFTAVCTHCKKLEEFQNVWQSIEV